MTSFQGRPADVDLDTSMATRHDSHVGRDVNIGSALLEHRVGARNDPEPHAVGDYDRFYQNFVPGAATPIGSQVTLTAYNNATQRTNVFNQTDVVTSASTGAIRHTLLGGAEVGRQRPTTSATPASSTTRRRRCWRRSTAPTISTPVTFRQSATDADNHLRPNVAAAFRAGPGRAFAASPADWRCARSTVSTCSITTTGTATRSSRTDNLVSPRAGVVVKPIDAALDLRQLQRVVSAQFGRSVLLADHDHAAGEAGAVHQLRSRREVGRVAAALAHDGGLPAGSHQHALDRSERSDADRPDRQPAHQRLRARLNGQVTARGAWPAATRIRTRSSRAPRRRRAPGAQVGQVPHHTFSLWNNYQFQPRLAAGLGIVHRSRHVRGHRQHRTLPGYTRADAALYYHA